jgi:hypothetical protein
VDNGGRSSIRQGRVGRLEAQARARRILISGEHPRFPIRPYDRQRFRLGGDLVAARLSAARSDDSDASQTDDADSHQD